MSDYIYIMDTTLRDGEQTPGVSLNYREKVEIAQQLARFNIDIIEAGFPATSQGELDSVRAIAEAVKGPAICCLARANEHDIDAVREALAACETPRCHLVIATSDLHLKYKLQMTQEQVLNAVERSVRYAANYFDYVEFSGEDAFRSDPDFLVRVCQTAIDAGARIINIPDTVGYALPHEFGEFVHRLMEAVPNSHRAIWSVHCHNDLGLAVANSLAAVISGARQVECTVNGIGERAGNTALEELIMTLETRRDLIGLRHGLELKELGRTSRLVANLTGLPIASNKAVVGKNAFRHESGIHQDGVLKNRLTYEIMDPKTIGVFRENIVLGKHSGRHGFKSYLEQMGFKINEDDFNSIFENFKTLADHKKDVTDRDIELLVEEKIHAVPEHWRLDYLHVSSLAGTSSTATVQLTGDSGSFKEASCGDGPISAIFNAIDRCAGVSIKLTHYALNAATGGKDAIGEAVIQVEYKGKTYSGHGISTDIIEASAKSYINALNRALYESEE